MQRCLAVALFVAAAAAVAATARAAPVDPEVAEALISATVPPTPSGPAPNGTTAQLWSWNDKRGGADALPAGATPAMACLAEAFKGAPRDRKVYSQWGEDGIIEAIFGCIGTTERIYVEFGTETCTECTTRYLRTKGWTGLLMDGSNENPSINLHREFMLSDNIVGLFQKYKVPHPTFDHLTADLDLNTLWVLRAVLAAGYRPRSVAIEYNRNFHPCQSYSTLDLPSEVWAGGCYYGASALAYERLMRAFGYSLVAFDTAGVNVFFVLDSEIGAPLPHSFADVTPDYNLPTWAPMHAPCQQMTWVHVEASPGLSQADFLRHMLPKVLSHSETPGARRFREVPMPASLLLHRHRRHGSAAQPAGWRRRRL